MAMTVFHLHEDIHIVVSMLGVGCPDVAAAEVLEVRSPSILSWGECLRSGVGSPNWSPRCGESRAGEVSGPVRNGVESVPPGPRLGISTVSCVPEGLRVILVPSGDFRCIVTLI